MRRLVLFAMLALTGCATFAAEAAQEAAGPAAKAGVTGLNEPKTRAELLSLMTSAEAQEGTRVLARAAADGFLDSLSDSERSAALERFARRLGAATAAGASSRADDTVAAMLQDPRIRESLKSLVREFSESAVSSAGEALESPESPGAPGSMKSAVRRTIQVGNAVIVGAGAFLLVLLLALAWAIGSSRRERRRVHERDARLVEALESAAAQGRAQQSPEVLRALELLRERDEGRRHLHH